jgi:O-antigen/teichoic acid export membrane protein
VTVSNTAKVIALSLGNGLTTLVGLVASIVLSRVLTILDYATYRQALLAYQFAEPLLSLALPMALYYFLPAEHDRKRGLLVDNVLLLTLMGSIFSLFLMLGGSRLLSLRFNNPDLEAALHLLIPYPIFLFPAGILSAVLVVHARTAALSVFNVASRGILGFLVIATCLLWRNPSAPLISQVVWSVLMLPIVLWLGFSTLPSGSLLPNGRSMLAMLKYSAPLGLATMLGTITLQLDKIIVSSLCIPEEFAIYANGAIEIPLIGTVTGAIATVILAAMSERCRGNEKEEALRLFHKAAVMSALVLFPTAVFLFIHAPDCILVLYSAKYLESVGAFRAYLLILPIRIVYYGSALMALGMTRTVLWRSVGDLMVNTILCIVLVHYIGYIGASISLVVTMYFWSVPFNLYAIGKGFSCRPWQVIPFGRSGIIMLISIVAGFCTGPIILWRDALPIFRLGMATLIYGMVYVALAYLFSTEAHSQITAIVSRTWKVLHGPKGSSI